MKTYTVLLLRPEYFAADFGLGKCLTRVATETVEAGLT